MRSSLRQLGFVVLHFITGNVVLKLIEAAVILYLCDDTIAISVGCLCRLNCMHAVSIIGLRRFQSLVLRTFPVTCTFSVPIAM